MSDTTTDTDRLAAVLSQRFGHVAARDRNSWGGNTALCVLDCVLSLKRRFDGFTLRAVDAEIWQLAARPPELRGNPTGPG